MVFTEYNHLVKGLDPVADAFSGTVYSDIINMKNFGHITFVIYNGVGTTGTSAITVQACDDVSGTHTTDLPFRYRKISTGDTPGALTAVANTGFTTTAGSSQLYVIEVDDEAMGATNYGYIRLKAVEVVNDPVLGGVLAICSEPRFAQAIFDTAIV